MVLVGESRDRRCNGVIRERKIISSVMGPWESGSAGSGGARLEDEGRGTREETDSDKIPKADPTAESVLEAMSLDPVPPSRFDNAALKEGASKEKGGEKKYFYYF